MPAVLFEVLSEDAREEGNFSLGSLVRVLQFLCSPFFLIIGCSFFYSFIKHSSRMLSNVDGGRPEKMWCFRFGGLAGKTQVLVLCWFQGHFLTMPAKSYLLCEVRRA